MDYFDILLAKKLEDDRDPKVEGLSVSANGRYHEDGVVYDPVIVNVPQTPLSKLTVTENGTYTAPSGTAYNEVEVDVPLPENAYLLKDIENTPTAIATFSDGANLPMPKLEVGIEPVQDLHGYDAPWVGGAGKNKLKYPYYASSTTINGVTFTVNDDGTVKVNGTASEDASFYLAYTGSNMVLPQGEYILNGCPSGGSNTTYMLNITNISTQDTGSGANFTSDGTTSLNIRIIVRANTSASNLLFKPMIRLATVSDATFAPYSNICPISGWDEVNVVRTGKNLIDVSKLAQQVVTSQGNLRPGVPVKLQTGTYTISAQSGSLPFYITRPANNYSYISINALPFTFSLDNEEEVIVRMAQPDISSWNYVNLQLEEGQTATPYEPFGSTITIQLGDTYYGGKLDVVNGVLKVTYGTKVYSGNSSEGWYADGTQSGSTYRMKASDVPNNIKLPPSNADAMSAISNQFIATSADDIFLGNEGIGIPTNGSYLTIYDSVYNTNDVSLWKTYLASNPMQLVYELATPLTIQLPTTVVKSLGGVNNVWGDCGDILDLSYLAKEE